VQQQLQKETGEVILLRDLTNLHAASVKSTTRNDHQEVANVLQQQHGTYTSHYAHWDNSCDKLILIFHSQQDELQSMAN